MANRNFNRLQALEKEVKTLHMKVAIGAAGAPTINAAQSQGVASITRVSAGLYDVVLQDNYMRLINIHPSIIAAAGEDLKIQIVSDSVASSTKTFRFRCVAVAAATDPANGDSILMSIELKNSSV